MTVPGYPVAGTHTKYYGGVVYRLPLAGARMISFRISTAIPADVLAKTKLLVLNYPNSPTGQDGDAAVLTSAVIEFAQKHKIVRDSRRGHVMLSYDRAAVEFLRRAGGQDVGVEVHSMSKGFHMIGWRLGWVCGHERIVRAFADVKDNCDSGQFIAIQKAGAAAAR